jgi:hypothetical protein
MRLLLDAGDIASRFSSTSGYIAVEAIPLATGGDVACRELAMTRSLGRRKEHEMQGGKDENG